jgi:glycosyltransferase involved in cell wall biosynthesis
LQAADGVIAVSHDLAKNVVDLGIDPAKVHIVPEGTDTTLFRPGDQSAARARLGQPAQGRMLLFVGNLLLSKGAGLVIEACGLLQDQGIDFRCCLVGGGKDEPRLRQMCTAKNLDARVHFAGRFPHDKLVDWYQACDVVTLPSYSEGSPNVLREAMCCGKPFVATRVGGIPEISSPDVSRLVNAGDVKSLAVALREMLDSPPKVDPRIPASHVISWDQSAARIDGLFRGAIAAKRAQGEAEPVEISTAPSA